MAEIEADDRRVHKYSNIQHPLPFRPEFLLSVLTITVAAVFTVTMWVSSVEQVANEAMKETQHNKELTNIKSMDIEKQIDDVKKNQEGIRRDMNRGFDRLNDTIKDINNREISRGG